MSGEPEVVLAGVTKSFASRDGGGGGGRGREGQAAALSDLSLTVERGEMAVLIGPSGCGKSTTLRLIAGLDDPDSGAITIAGRAMAGVAPQERDVAMVFQGYALYPQMTAREIIEFPLKMRGVPSAERARAVDEAAAMLGLGRLLNRRPDQLSGGERQRVAMGRALVRRPRVFLFDEPLANIDPALREDIRLEIASLVRRVGATALYVTHDHAEAMTLADRIAVMRASRLLQWAPPREVYERPADEFVGTFVGSPRMNVIDAEVTEGGVRAGPFALPRPAGTTLPSRVRVGVRPEDVRVLPAGEGEAQGELVAVEPLGAETHLAVKLSDALTLRARRQGFERMKRGDRVGVALDTARVHVFDPARDGARIAPEGEGGA